MPPSARSRRRDGRPYPARLRQPPARAVVAAAPVLRGLLCRALDPDRGARPDRRLVLVHRSGRQALWYADHPGLATRAGNPRPCPADQAVAPGSASLQAERRRGRVPIPRIGGLPRLYNSLSVVSKFQLTTGRRGRSGHWTRPRGCCWCPGSASSLPAPAVAPRPSRQTWPRPQRKWSATPTPWGPFRSCPDADLFDVEYWSLEQAKLGNRRPLAFEGHVVVITGGAGAIGRATARAFQAEGAEVVLLDRDRRALSEAANDVQGLAIETDLTREDSVALAFDETVRTYGGLDILVSNAGVAFAGAIAEVDEATLRESFEGELLCPPARGSGRGRRVSAHKGSAVACFSTCPSSRCLRDPSLAPTARPRRRPSPSCGNMLWSAAATVFGPTRSTPTASEAAFSTTQ